MTVRELIEKLQRLDPTLEVVTPDQWDDEGGDCVAEELEVLSPSSHAKEIYPRDAVELMRRVRLVGS